jgi:hypothetical protein
MSETKTVPVRMARATHDDIDRVVKFFQLIEEYMEYGTHTPQSDEFEEESIELTPDVFVHYLRTLWHGSSVEPSVDGSWSRVVNGYAVLVDNICDPNSDVLEYKPELAAKLSSPD